MSDETQPNPNQYDAYICGECNSKDINFQADEPHCNDCGLVMKEWAVDLGTNGQLIWAKITECLPMVRAQMRNDGECLSPTFITMAD
jgi:hypothetical protein